MKLIAGFYSFVTKSTFPPQKVSGRNFWASRSPQYPLLKPEFGPAGQVPVMPMTTHGFGSRGPRRAVDKTKTRYDDMTKEKDIL